MNISLILDLSIQIIGHRVRHVVIDRDQDISLLFNETDETY